MNRCPTGGWPRGHLHQARQARRCHHTPVSGMWKHQPVTTHYATRDLTVYRQIGYIRRVFGGFLDFSQKW